MAQHAQPVRVPGRVDVSQLLQRQQLVQTDVQLHGAHPGRWLVNNQCTPDRLPRARRFVIYACLHSRGTNLKHWWFAVCPVPMLMVSHSGIGNVTTALKAAGLWEESLVMFAGDNGGWVGDFGSNNYPLKGQKPHSTAMSACPRTRR